MSETKKVYEVINSVHAEIAKVGIAKGQENTFDKYKFRGIDDVYNVISPILAKNKLCIIPTIKGRELVERGTKNGGVTLHMTVEVDYAFIAVEDGSEYHVTMFGEAMDRGDKAFLKALSAAYKSLVFQTFAIPTEGGIDSENETHEIAATTRHDAENIMQKKRGAIFQSLLKFDAEPIELAFEEHGFVSDAEEKEENLRDLVKQIDSPEKAVLIVARVRELQNEMDEREKKARAMTTASSGEFDL